MSAMLPVCEKFYQTNIWVCSCMIGVLPTLGNFRWHLIKVQIKIIFHVNKLYLEICLLSCEARPGFGKFRMDIYCVVTCGSVVLT